MNLHPVLAWLGQQLHVAGSVVSGVAANGVMPAREVAVYTLILAVLVTSVAPKVLKALKK